jgi:CheY-like chemotaxis protein
MPNGGLLTIRTEKLQIQNQQDSDSPVAEGPYIVITVSDSGVGMDALTREHLFEPFFTTKELGKGTGLGLSMVYGIVRQSGGQIVVDSELGKGSKFRISLPLVDAAVGRDKDSTEALPARGGKGTILVVEDETEVRALLAETLNGFGYSVIEAKNGQDALEVAKASLSNIDLLITDMVMPQINGRELSQTLRARRPALPVLFISGYSDVIPSEEEFFNATTQFVQKPFTPESLAHRVHELLLLRDRMSKSAVASK